MNELDLFAAAIAIADPAERASLLDRESLGRPDMRQRIDQLLEAHFGSHPILDQHIPERTGAYTANEQPGVVIAGRYKLLEAIGEGGMGTVWVAEQTQPVRRKVALKLIKAGMDSKSVLARFEAERQALAVMDHPSVAKVLDGGLTETGRPFFVMEYVKGVPITEYCDATRLSVPERLELFAQVCQAVQHAHQKGIIHRDLKPSNILVAPYDDKAVPKIIDFGLAKAMHQSLTEKTLHTAHETVLGTPLYMSPEQAQLNNLDVDTRSDIYSLGVLLYELLTGTTPLEKQRFREAAWDEVRRIIREEEPPRPSTRLSSANTLPSLAACRQSEPLKLTKQVRGELDWIVMKALEKDRSRRYETANGFAQDVLRFLVGESVQAYPPSTTYRLKKFVRRNKGQVIAASLVFFALLAGVIGTSVGLVRANRSAENERLAKIDADEKREKAELAEQRERDRAEGERQARQRESAQRDRAEKAYAHTVQVLDTMVSEITGESLATQKAITAEQKKFLTEVVTYYREFAGEKADDKQTRRRTALAAYRVGLIEHRLGRREEAATAFRMACDAYTTLAADFPDVPAFRQALAGNHLNLGNQLCDTEKWTEAEEQYRKAIAIKEKLVAEFPAVPTYRLELATGHYNLALILMEHERNPEAVEHYRKALALQEMLVAKSPGNSDYRYALARTLTELGGLLTDLGPRSEAEEHLRKGLVIHEKLVADFPSVPDYRHDLARGTILWGLKLVLQERQQEAEQSFRKALEIWEKLAAEFPVVPMYRLELASIYNIHGETARLADKLSDSLAWFTKAVGVLTPMHEQEPKLMRVNQSLRLGHARRAYVCDRLGRHAEAISDWDKAIALCPKEMLGYHRASRSISRFKAGQLPAAVAEIAELTTPGANTTELGTVNGDQWYDFACIYAVASVKVADKKEEYAKRAMELLHQAIKIGYKDYPHVTRDTDLDPLRNREDFKKLMAELEKAPKK